MKLIRGTSYHYIDSSGQIYGKKGHRVRLTLSDTGYYVFSAGMEDGSRKVLLYHRVKYENLIGHIPEGMTINHKNGNKLDNSDDNLEIMSLEDNSAHSRWVLGNGAIHPNRILIVEDIKNIAIMFNSGMKLKEISRITKIHRSKISQVVTENSGRYQESKGLFNRDREPIYHVSTKKRGSSILAYYWNGERQVTIGSRKDYNSLQQIILEHFGDKPFYYKSATSSSSEEFLR